MLILFFILLNRRGFIADSTYVNKVSQQIKKKARTRASVDMSLSLIFLALFTPP
jgi:hypothetical protein